LYAVDDGLGLPRFFWPLMSKKHEESREMNLSLNPTISILNVLGPPTLGNMMTLSMISFVGAKVRKFDLQLYLRKLSVGTKNDQ